MPQLYTQHSKTGNVYKFVNVNIQSFTSQIVGVVGPLGENLDFFSPLGFDVQTNSDQKTQKNQALLRALKRHHGRVMGTISKFSPQIFRSQRIFEILVRPMGEDQIMPTEKFVMGGQ